MTAPAVAAAERFAQLLDTADTAGALAMTEPGSPAHLYAEGIHLLAMSRFVARSSRPRARPVLAGFVLTPGGLITSLSRNGCPLDKLIVPGATEVFTLEPGGVEHITGTVGATVHSFRLFDGELQIVVTNTNHSTEKAGLTFTEYTENGRGYNSSCRFTAFPGTAETSVNGFIGASGGGTAYGRFTVNGTSGPQVELAVPVVKMVTSAPGSGAPSPLVGAPDPGRGGRLSLESTVLGR